MNLKLLTTMCVIITLTPACSKHENPLLNSQTIAALKSIISDGKMPGDCRKFFVNPNAYPSRINECEKKVHALFLDMRDKEPFLQASIEDIKDQKLWEQFYKQYPNFDFFIE